MIIRTTATTSESELTSLGLPACKGHNYRARKNKGKVLCLILVKLKIYHDDHTRSKECSDRRVVRFVGPRFSQLMSTYCEHLRNCITPQVCFTTGSVAELPLFYTMMNLTDPDSMLCPINICAISREQRICITFGLYAFEICRRKYASSHRTQEPPCCNNTVE